MDSKNKYTEIGNVSEKVLARLAEIAYRSVGSGDKNKRWENNLKHFDKIGLSNPLPQQELKGFTFITRPSINLSSHNLRAGGGFFSTLDTTENKSLQYAIRNYLDSELQFTEERERSKTASFFNHRFPFIIPLCNNLASISGWPDFALDVETTQGGWFGQNQVFPVGSDDFDGVNELSLTFKGMHHGIIEYMLLIWGYYIHKITRGEMTPYAKFIDMKNLDYTCSIYRFIMDVQNKRIVKYAKATGCFPKNISIGDSFNTTEGEHMVKSNHDISVNFAVNHVEYHQPLIFSDFNLLMSKFSRIDETQIGKKYQLLDNVPENNFIGYPYIDRWSGENRLLFIDLDNAGLDDGLLGDEFTPRRFNNGPSVT